MNVTNSIEQTDAGFFRNPWLWVFLLGIILFVLGICAITYASITSVIAMFWFGALLIASGIIQIFSLFIAKKHDHFFLNLYVSILSLIAGFWIIFQPLLATIFFLWFITLYLFISGMLHLIFAFSSRKEAWYWMLFNGFIEIILAFMVWGNWPVTGLWAIGLFISIHVLLSGWYLMVLALLIRSAYKIK